MGRRGPRPKPTKLKELAGNPGKRALNRNEPRPPRANRTPGPPAHLSVEARKAWKRLARDLHALGLLTRVDYDALAAYCETWATWVEAKRRLRESNLVLRSGERYVRNPLLIIIDESEKRMHRWLAEFGMTPSSRSRVQVELEEDEQDPMALLLEQSELYRRRQQKEREKKAVSG